MASLLLGWGMAAGHRGWLLDHCSAQKHARPETELAITIPSLGYPMPLASNCTVAALAIYGFQASSCPQGNFQGVSVEARDEGVAAQKGGECTIDMYTDMFEDICIDTCVDMCIDTCIVAIDMCIDMCDICERYTMHGEHNVGMCLEMCIDKYRMWRAAA